MDIELRDYQKQCLSRISELLSIGKKHFSIAMLECLTIANYYLIAI